MRVRAKGVITKLKFKEKRRRTDRTMYVYIYTRDNTTIHSVGIGGGGER